MNLRLFDFFTFDNDRIELGAEVVDVLIENCDFDERGNSVDNSDDTEEHHDRYRATKWIDDHQDTTN